MASEVTKRLRDRRLSVWEEAKGLADTAATENRAFSAEEQGKWDVLNGELDQLDTRIKSALDAEKRMKDTDAAFDALSGRKQADVRGGAGSSFGRSVAAYQDQGRDINAEFRAFVRGEAGSPRAMEFRHQNGAFGDMEYRTLLSNSGSPTSVVPIDFYDRLISYLIEVSGVMQAGPTVLNTAGGEQLNIPKATVHGNAASAAQGASLPTADPTFAQATLNAYKYGKLVQVATELIEDTSVDLLGYLAMQCGRAVGNAFGSDLVNGAGSSAPAGLIYSTSASPGVTGGAATAASGWAATGAPSYANLVDMEYSVIAPYRQSRSCYWIAADRTVGGLRKLTDTNGRPVWEPSTVLGAPDLLLGKPIVADPYMPAVGSNAFSIAFGDMAQFFVRLVGGVRFERSDDFNFGSDLVTFRCLIRGDGTLVDTTAVKVFKGGST